MSSVRYNPRPYQKKCIKFCLQRNCAGLFLDPGLGKTSICLTVFAILQQEKMVKRALVIAPKRVAYSVWPKEVAKWKDFKGMKVEVLHGKKKEERFYNGHDVSVVNPEGLSWLLREASHLRQWPWDMLIIDESTKFKNTRSLRSKILKPHLTKFRRRYILTGTPSPNGLLDLFGQIFIVDLGRSLGTYITHYRAAYFEPSGYGGFAWKIKTGGEKKIYKRLKDLVIRMDAKDHIRLPPLVFNYIEVELEEKARLKYDQMESMLLTAVDDQLITAANGVVAAGKCRQIANGGLFTNTEEGKYVTVHDAKVDALEDLIEELDGKPALIAYEFRHDLERIKARFGDVPHIGGGVSEKRALELEDAWNRGELPMLLVQPQSVAHGLNLQEVASAVVWFGLTWNLEDYEQLYRRVWRSGQKERVVVHHIIAKDTVDQVVLAALKRKRKTQKDLLDALREYSRAKTPHKPTRKNRRPD